MAFTRSVACIVMACVGGVDIMLGFYLAIITIEHVLAENMSDQMWKDFRHIFDEKRSRHETIRICKNEIAFCVFLLFIMIAITVVVGVYLV